MMEECGRQFLSQDLCERRMRFFLILNVWEKINSKRDEAVSINVFTSFFYSDVKGEYLIQGKHNVLINHDSDIVRPPPQKKPVAPVCFITVNK